MFSNCIGSQPSHHTYYSQLPYSQNTRLPGEQEKALESVIGAITIIAIISIACMAFGPWTGIPLIIFGSFIFCNILTMKENLRASNTFKKPPNPVLGATIENVDVKLMQLTKMELQRKNAKKRLKVS